MAKSAAAKAAGKSAPKREYKQTNQALSKMVGFLRYRSEEAKTIDQSKKDATKEALEIYRTLSDPSTRLSFLSNFQEAGSGKTADALNVAIFEFRQTLVNKKNFEVGVTEDFWTRHVANS